MKYIRFALTVMAGFTLVSCNENETAKPTAKTSFFDSLQKGGTVSYSPNMNNQPGVTNAGAPAARPQLDLSGMTVSGQPAAEKAPVEPVIQIPADARWTLYCAVVSGPDRFARIGQLKTALIARSGLTDWYVIHNETSSTLFYGFFSAVEKSERAGAIAHAQQKQIQELRNEQGERMFAACFFTPIVQPDPVAPAEWKLSNAPAKAYWSLQIAAFRDDPLRKQAAVETVKELRAKGVEAYYFHGESISSVCIGAWPMDSVARQDDDKGRTVSPDDDIMVSNQPLPERYEKLASIVGKDGHRVRAYAQRVEISDPSLKAAMADYPTHFVNYKAYSRNIKTEEGTTKEVVSPSLLVVIPRTVDTSTLAGQGGMPGMLNQVGGAPPQDPMHQPGTGRLRGLGN